MTGCYESPDFFPVTPVSQARHETTIAMEEKAFLAGERRERTAWDSDGDPLVDRGRVSCEHPATGELPVIRILCGSTWGSLQAQSRSRCMSQMRSPSGVRPATRQWRSCARQGRLP